MKSYFKSGLRRFSSQIQSMSDHIINSWFDSHGSHINLNFSLRQQHHFILSTTTYNKYITTTGKPLAVIGKFPNGINKLMSDYQWGGNYQCYDWLAMMYWKFSGNIGKLVL